MKEKQTKKKKKPWPTKDAMVQIYEKKLWGDDSSKFYSGDGSHLPEMVQPYITAVREFLTSFEKPLNVCDVGCGDFNVGEKLVSYAEKYIAVDIVPALIAYNQKKFQAENLEFHCLDVAVDALPFGECVLIRQVLQHLSNTEVQGIFILAPPFNFKVKEAKELVCIPLNEGKEALVTTYYSTI